MKLNLTFRYVVAIAFSAILFGGCYTMIYHKEFSHLEEKPVDVVEETEIIYYPLPDIYPPPVVYPDPIIILIPAPTPPQPPAAAVPVKYREPENNGDRHRDGGKTTIRDNDGNRSGNNRSERQRR